MLTLTKYLILASCVIYLGCGSTSIQSYEVRGLKCSHVATRDRFYESSDQFVVCRDTKDHEKLLFPQEEASEAGVLQGLLGQIGSVAQSFPLAIALP